MSARPDRESVMRQWDALREYFKDGDAGGSHPRDVFENILDQYDDAIEALEGKLKAAHKLAVDHVFEREAEAEFHYKVGTADAERTAYVRKMQGAMAAVIANDILNVITPGLVTRALSSGVQDGEREG